MRLTQDKNVLRTNNQDFERQQFTIGDMRIVLEVLTKLYSNPIQTITQEYICNARDANRESKSKKTIEITIPTRFSPTLKIRDYGIGLNPDRISNVFLKYGNSTKRDNNNETGGFGIGAKSAWAYTDSFVITSYVDGIKRTYLAHKSSGNGNLDLLETTNTNKPNGTCIEIAVKECDASNFKNAVLRTTFFWKEKEKPIIHGLQEVENEELNIIKLADKYHIYNKLPNFINSGYDSKTLVVIDGIPYNVRNDNKFKGLYELQQKVKTNNVFFADTGFIQIAPNREEFIDQEHTWKKLGSLITDCKTLVENHIKTEQSKSTDIKSSIDIGKELLKNFKIKIKFKNYEIVSYNRNMLEIAGLYKSIFLRPYINSANKLCKEKSSSVLLDKLDDIYYQDIEEAAIFTFRRVRHQIESNNNIRLINKEYQEDPLVQEFIKDLKIKKISSLHLPAIKRQGKKQNIQKKKFCLHYLKYGSGLRPTQSDLSEISSPIAYDILKSNHYKNRHNNFHVWETLRNKGYKIAFISESSVKIIANSKHFTPIDDIINNYVLTDKEKLGLKAQLITNRRELNKFCSHIVDIKDKDLKIILNVVKQTNKNAETVPKAFAKDFIKSNDYEALKKTYETVDKRIKTRYPLFDSLVARWSITSKIKNDLVEYINYKYKRIKK